MGPVASRLNQNQSARSMAKRLPYQRTGSRLPAKAKKANQRARTVYGMNVRSPMVKKTARMPNRPMSINATGHWGSSAPASTGRC